MMNKKKRSKHRGLLREAEENLSFIEKEIVALLRGVDGMDLTTLSRTVHLSKTDMFDTLVRLECKGMVTVGSNRLWVAQASSDHRLAQQGVDYYSRQ
jgi:uncharacterized membrane protein